MIQVFEDSSTRLLSLGLTNLRVAYKPVGLVRTASLTILRFAYKPYGFVSKRIHSFAKVASLANRRFAAVAYKPYGFVKPTAVQQGGGFVRNSQCSVTPSKNYVRHQTLPRYICFIPFWRGTGGMPVTPECLLNATNLRLVPNLRFVVRCLKKSEAETTTRGPCSCSTLPKLSKSSPRTNRPMHSKPYDLLCKARLRFVQAGFASPTVFQSRQGFIKTELPVIFRQLLSGKTRRSAYGRCDCTAQKPKLEPSRHMLRLRRSKTLSFANETLAYKTESFVRKPKVCKRSCAGVYRLRTKAKLLLAQLRQGPYGTLPRQRFVHKRLQIEDWQSLVRPPAQRSLTKAKLLCARDLQTASNRFKQTSSTSIVSKTRGSRYCKATSLVCSAKKRYSASAYSIVSRRLAANLRFVAASNRSTTSLGCSTKKSYYCRPHKSFAFVRETGLNKPEYAKDREDNKSVYTQQAIRLAQQGSAPLCLGRFRSAEGLFKAKTILWVCFLRASRYSNRVGFRIILVNTEVKWDHGVYSPFSPVLGPSASRPEQTGAEPMLSGTLSIGSAPVCSGRRHLGVENQLITFWASNSHSTATCSYRRPAPSVTALQSRARAANKAKYKTIRPLLNLSRENLTNLCKDLRLPVYPDKSNKAVQYSRNRLREQILPAVKLFINPKIEDALFKLAELLTQDFSVVSRLATNARRLKL